MPGKRKPKKKKGKAEPQGAAKGLKVCGPSYIQTLQGRLLGREVALLCCGEAHEDWIDLTRERCVVQEERGWIKVPCDDGKWFDPEDAIATQDNLTLPSAKTWAERLVTAEDSEAEDDGGFLVFEREGAGSKARGTGRVYPEDAERSSDHRAPASAVAYEWADKDPVARELNRRRLAGEQIPLEEQDAIAAARKKLRLEEGVELFDDWLLRQTAAAAQRPGVEIKIVLEAAVPAHEVELQGASAPSALPASPACIRGLEPDSEEDEEDQTDPSASGDGSFLDYLRRRLGELPRGQVLCCDPRDLGDPHDEASFRALLRPGPLPPDPDEEELAAAGGGACEDGEAESEASGSESGQGEAAVPSWEAYLSATAELLYYSPHIKADFAPFLAGCVRSYGALWQFHEALYFKTVPEATAVLAVGGTSTQYTRVRSPILQEAAPPRFPRTLFASRAWQEGGQAVLKRRPHKERQVVPVCAAPVDRYLKASGTDPPRTWVSGLAERVRCAGGGELVQAAKTWLKGAVQHLLADPKKNDPDGDYFAAWLRACHRAVYDDIDRSDPEELASKEWAWSDSHPKSKKHRYNLKDIRIPNGEQAFQELLRFDPAKRVSTARERVLAKILLDCFQVRMVDLAAVLRTADAVLSSPEGAKVVVVVYTGVDHARAVEQFWRGEGFSSDFLEDDGLAGKEDFEEDEPHVFVLPSYLHDLGELFPVP